MKRKRRLKWKRIFGLGILCVSLLCFGLWMLIHPIQERYDPDLFVLDQGIMTYQDKAYTTSIGIDVSEHNGHIDWNAVKEDGIEFAFIRLGYRGAIEGEMHEDENFRYNLEAAKQAGLLVGAYWYSSAISLEELDEEAQYVLSLLEEEELDLPVAYDMEIFDAQNGRICSLDKEEKTMMALRFCDAMETAGYRSMIYGNYNWLYEQLDFSQIQKKAIWYAAYRDRPDMTDPFEIWQYSNMGQVQGITGNVDLNICLVKNN